MKPYPQTAIRRARRLRQDMTGSEKRLWGALRKLDLNIRRQVPIGRYIADFASLQHRLVIEIDGGCHDLPQVQLRDDKRDAWLRSQGYRILRIRDQHVFHDLVEVVELILMTLPPRGGKGRDEGVRAELEGLAPEAELAPSAIQETSCTHPHPRPFPPRGGREADNLQRPVEPATTPRRANPVASIEGEDALHPDHITPKSKARR